MTVRDESGRIPTYVVEQEGGDCRIRNQCTGETERVGPYPSSPAQVARAHRRILDRERGWIEQQKAAGWPAKKRIRDDVAAS